MTVTDWRQWAVFLHEAALQGVKRALAENPSVAHAVDAPGAVNWTVSIDVMRRRADVLLVLGTTALHVGTFGLDPNKPGELGEFVIAALVVPDALTNTGGTTH